MPRIRRAGGLVRSLALVSCVATAGLIGFAGPARAGVPATPNSTSERPSAEASRFIVRLSPADPTAGSAVESAVRAAGGRVLRRLPALGMIVVSGPAVLGVVLTATPGVVAVAPDGAVR